MKTSTFLQGCAIVAIGTTAACGGNSPAPGNAGAPFDNGAAGSAGSTSGGTGSSGGVASAAPYPSGPYGAGVGSTMQNLEFLGLTDPPAAGYDANKLTKITLSDFYNPDGSKPDKLLLINVSARWCTVCQSEYSSIRASGKYDTYKAEGVQFFGVLFEDANYNPAAPTDLSYWTKTYQITWPFVLDPGFKMGVYFSADATPLNMIVDARTMQIKAKILGYDPTSSALWDQLDQLAKQ